MEQPMTLASLDSDQAHLWGAKATALARWKREGFPVPDGVVIPVGTRPAPMQDLVSQVPALLGSGPFAVRSSSVAEDQALASMAGAFTTVLNVHAAGLPQAIEQVLGSAGEWPMAVLIQRMVRASSSGIAFSSDPVSGIAGDVAVNAVPGLGNQLAEGVVSPDEWTVRSGVPELNAELPGMPKGSGALTPDQVQEVALMVTELASIAGTAQDIEWAYEDSVLYLLQSRPVTTLVDPVPVPIVVPAGTWRRDEGHGLSPRTPLTRSVFDENPALLNMAETAGLLMRVAIVDIGGWHYSGLKPMGLPPLKDKKRVAPSGQKKVPKMPPAWLLPVLYRLLPGTRRQLRSAKLAEASDLPGRTIMRWEAEFRPALELRLRALHRTDLAGATDAGLLQQLREARTLVRDGLEIHFLLGAPLMLALAELHFFLSEALDWNAARTMDLLAGTSAMSSEPARRLAVVAALDEDDPEFVRLWADYRRFYGSRALELELSSPTLAESPLLLNNLLASQRTAAFRTDEVADELRASRLEVANTTRNALPQSARDDFDRLLERATAAYPVREANVFFTIDAPLAAYRYAAMEAGRRAAAAGLLEHPADVFFCTAYELEGCLSPGDEFIGNDGGTQLRGMVRRRRGEHLWTLAHPGPQSYGPPPPPVPSLKGFPSYVRLATRALVWAGESIVEPALSSRTSAAAGNLLTGIGASPGRVEGTVRIIRGEGDFGRIGPGDVLVCPCTRPSWSVIFPAVSAIITDSGGTLSHPAIIAREHRIPAVVATGCATDVLKDGMAVLVDGTAGTVSY